MTAFKFEKGRLKVGRWSLTHLALAEAAATLTIFILSITIGWNAFKDARCYFSWRSALRDYGSRNPAGATAGCQTAISWRPEFPGPRLMKGNLVAETDDIPGAREEFDTVLRLDPNNEAAQVSLGVLSLKEYDKKKNEALLKQAQSQFSSVAGQPDALIGLGGVNVRRRDFTGADKNFSEAERATSPASLQSVYDMYVAQAWIALQRHEYNKARESYERARFMDPTRDRMLANVAYMRSRRMWELELTREKFDEFNMELRDFNEKMWTLYTLDQEGRKYFVPSMVQLNDAWACLAIRSYRLGNAAQPLGFLRTLNPNAKQPTLNYIVTLARAMLSPSLTTEEVRAYLSELAVRLQEALNMHKDLTNRERIVILQYDATRSIIENVQFDFAVEQSTKAIDQYSVSGLAEPKLEAALYRTRAVAEYRKAVNPAMPAGAEKEELMRKAVEDGEKSLALEDQPDLREWVQKIKLIK